jgi:hypothetical protein
VKWIKSGKHNGKKNENDKRQLAVGGSTGSAAEQRATRKGRQRSTGQGERIKRQQQKHGLTAEEVMAQFKKHEAFARLPAHVEVKLI